MRARVMYFVVFFIAVIVCIQMFEFRRLVTVTHYKVVPDRKIKVILSWIPFFGDYYYGLPNSDTAFSDIGCVYNNCIITSNRGLMHEHEFDALLFHGYEFYEIYFRKPKYRSAEQYYVFMSLESAGRGGIPERMEDFYNVTMTYRLDSDIPWPYFRIRDINDVIVGPKIHMNWVDFEFKLDDALMEKVKKKNKKAAWFVSNCRSVNKRGEYVEKLQEFIDIDIFGRCGPFKCELSENDTCNKMLEDDYFFYLAFENSHCQDYITEKVLTALNSHTVPVVYGYVNFTRFLPPGSYIDANLYSPEQLALFLDDLMRDADRYASYFWWRRFYKYEKSMPADVFPRNLHPFCELCKLLHTKPNMDGRKVRRFWHGTDERPTCLKSSEIQI